MREVTLPELGEGVKEALLTSILISKGDKISENQDLFELETDKANFEFQSPVSGIVDEIKVKEGDSLHQGDLLFTLNSESGSEQPEEKSDDQEKEKEKEEKKEKESEEVQPEPKKEAPKASTEVKLSNWKRLAIKGLEKSWSEIPHVTTTRESSIRTLQNLREQYNNKSELHLTLTSFIIKICAHTLGAYPLLNAHYLGEAKVETFSDVHMGIAMDADGELALPVIKNLNQKSIKDIQTELVELKDKVESKSLEISDVSGATFSLTNLGALEVSHFTPIISHPQTAILGIGAEKNGSLPLILSHDHRIINGAEAAYFLRSLEQNMNHPEKLLVELE